MNRSLLLGLTILSAMLVSSIGQAEPRPQADCRIRHNGVDTGQVIQWNRFFSEVNEFSRIKGCAVGKIYETRESGRMYINGRKVGTELSNAEIKEYRESYGYNQRTCPTITCVELGNDPSVDPDSDFHIGEYACINHVMDKGYGPSSAKSACSGIDTSSELSCAKYVLSKGYGPNTMNSTCVNVGLLQFQCIKNIMDRGYSPSSAKQTCSQ